MTIDQTIQAAIEQHQAGRLAEAEQCYRQILIMQPGHANALRLLGIVVMQQGQADLAVELIARAIAIHPTAPEYHVNLGNALKAAGKIDAAIEAFYQALRLRPAYHQAHYNLGVALADNGRWDAAITAFHDALHVKGDYPEALNNLGAALEKKGQGDEAVAAYRKALALRPGYAEAHHNLGHALAELGQLDEAEASYREAIGLVPDFVSAHWNLSLVLLMRGNFQQGWIEYEWRWRSEGFPTPRRSFPQPQWDGGDLNGRTLLLHTEQGFGDAIQFIRYAPWVARQGGRVILACQPEMMGLMKRAMGIDQVVNLDELERFSGGCRGLRDERVAEATTPATSCEPDRSTVLKNALANQFPPFDVHCPLMSLPLTLFPQLESIPSETPYIVVDPNHRQAWEGKMAAAPPGLRVGLTWSGRTRTPEQRRRAIHFSQLAPLWHADRVTFYSLQKGEAASQAAGRGTATPLIDLAPELHDFSDTAALISQLDLVITVDTAVAHLAGAMGKPVWVLLAAMPDWRWMLEREDSPWYPTARLFRQKKPGDWAEVIESVAPHLAAIL